MTRPLPGDDKDVHVGDDPPEDQNPPVDPPGGDPDDGDADPPADLGDAGKRALDAMKAKWKAERDARKSAESERDQLKLATSKNDQTKEAERIRQEAETAARQRADMRIIRSEVKAAATGKLADPKDALTFLDLSKFEVDENGEVDSDEVESAIDDLVKSKPYLAAATGKRFQGTGDNGAARKSGPKQVTESELKTMKPEQIEKARLEGRLADLLSGKA